MTAIIIAGYPGVGKTAIADLFVQTTGSVLLNRDSFAKPLSMNMVPEYFTDYDAFYDKNSYALYEGLQQQAIENAHLDTVILAPFHDTDGIRDGLAGKGIHILLVLVTADPDDHRHQLIRSGRVRDVEKAENFEEWLNGLTKLDETKFHLVLSSSRNTPQQNAQRIKERLSLKS